MARSRSACSKVFRQGLLRGALQRNDDLRFGREVVLHARLGLWQRRIDDQFQDVAVLGDGARIPPFGDAQHVENRLGLVEIGHRLREYGPQRIAQRTVPGFMPADDDEFVGASLCGHAVRIAQAAECVATNGGDREKEHGSEPQCPKRGEMFHLRKR